LRTFCSSPQAYPHRNNTDHVHPFAPPSRVITASLRAHPSTYPPTRCKHQHQHRPLPTITTTIKSSSSPGMAGVHTITCCSSCPASVAFTTQRLLADCTNLDNACCCCPSQVAVHELVGQVLKAQTDCTECDVDLLNSFRTEVKALVAAVATVQRWGLEVRALMLDQRQFVFVAPLYTMSVLVFMRPPPPRLRVVTMLDLSRSIGLTVTDGSASVVAVGLAVGPRMTRA
jgi:hypothetical protein